MRTPRYMSGLVLEVQKYAWINELENIIAYWEESERSETLDNEWVYSTGN